MCRCIELDIDTNIHNLSKILDDDKDNTSAVTIYSMAQLVEAFKRTISVQNFNFGLESTWVECDSTESTTSMFNQQTNVDRIQIKWALNVL